MASQKVPPLQAVTLVFRSKTQLLDLPHVIDAVSLFLDSSLDIPPLQACRLGSVRLLDRIWASSEGYVDLQSIRNLQETFSLRKFLRTDTHYQQYVFTATLEDAVPRKDLALVKWFLEKFQGFQVSSEIVARACLAGSMEILQLLYDNDTNILQQKGVNKEGHRVEWGVFTMSAAIQNRRSDIVWWLYRHFPEANYDLSAALHSAVKNGEILMAEWLVTRGAVWPDGDFASKIAAEGRLDVLKWLDERGQVDGRVGLVMKAAENGHDDVVRWLVERMTQNTSTHPHPNEEGGRAIHFAAANGHLQIAKYLRGRYSQPWIPTEEQIIELRRSFEELGNWTAYTRIAGVCGKTMVIAAQNGHLDVV